MINVITQKAVVLVVLFALLAMSGFGSVASAQGPGKGKSNAPGLVIAAANQVSEQQEEAEEVPVVEEIEQQSEETSVEEEDEEATTQDEEDEVGTSKEEQEVAQEEEESQFQFMSLVVAQESDHIYQDNSLMPECEEESPNEWHWVINGVSGTAPASIIAHFATGDVTVYLDKVTGGVAHYTHFGNLNDFLVAPGATAEYDGGYIRFNLSHGPCVQPLDIDKTAETFYKVKWTWGIVKWADTTNLGELLPGVTDTVNYKVTVEGSSEEIDHMVSGTITIANPANNPDATIVSVVDTLSHTGIIDIDCGDDVEFPYELEAGEMLACTYSTDVDDKDDTLNTVTVTTSGAVEGGFATANVVWGNPDNVIDECIYVSDTNANGPQNEEVCAGDLDVNGEFKFMYEVTFSKDDEEADILWKCGQDEYMNVASFITNDTETEGESDWAVDGYIACFCSLSQGYWFAKPKVNWNPKLELGGYEYSKSDGSSIWKAPNKGGIPTAKQAFTQYAAIMLSAEKYGTIGDIPSEVQDALDVIEAYFDGKPKLTSSNYNKTNIFPNNAAVKQAAGFIGDWIDENHCED